MARKLVLIGGGHAHMMLLANIHKFVGDGVAVTVIQPSEHHYYSGMGAGMLGGNYQPDDIRFQTKLVVEQQGGKFITDHAVSIDPRNQLVTLKSGEQISYDVLSCNAGSYVPRTDQGEFGDAVITVKPIEKLNQARQSILAKLHSEPLTVAVVGGGPSAVEVAGNLRQLANEPELKPLRIQMFCGSSLMSRLPEKVRTLSRELLKKRDVELIEGTYVKSMDNSQVILENGETYKADIIFSALGVVPSPIFSRSGLPTGPGGGLQVNEYLQSTAYDNIFGGGDCIYFEPQPLDKVGVYAVRQNPVLLHNISARLKDASLQPFNPGGKYLLIYNLGCGEGILAKWTLVFSGALAFRIKDYIDRKFMKTFQVLETQG